MTEPSARGTETRFALGVAALFGALALAGVLRHEMWRDELEIWLIARDSAGLGDLLANMATEGHPALWYVATWLLAQLTRAPLAMQLLNVAIGTAAAVIVAREAPLPRWARALFVLGYFPLYEYTVITRSYALELLLLSAFCARLSRRRAIDGAGTLLLVLLAHTNLFGTIFAGLIVALAILLRLGRSAAVGFRASWTALGFVTVAAAVAFVHTLIQSRAIGPDHAGAYRPGFDLRWGLDCLATVARGFVPFTDPRTYTGWNSTILDLLPPGVGSWIGAAAGLFLVVACVRALGGVPHVRVVFLVGAATMLAITLFVWFGFARHHGQHFVWFLACAWIGAAIGPERPGPQIARGGRAWLAGLLTIHAVTAAHAYLLDLALPFSNARAVAAYLDTPEFRELPVVGSVDYSVEPVAGYLDRPVWYPESDRFGTFLDWSDRRRLVSPVKVLADATALSEREGRDVVLILSYKLSATPQGRSALRPWNEMPLGATASLGAGATVRSFARFTGANVEDENYHLYRVSVPARGPR